jgi:phenylpyruvate tautomerase PptA (4-oxalocrotonate tautomerase family)
MPVIKICIYKGVHSSEKREICNAIQDSIKKSLNITHDNFHQRIFEFDEEHLFIPPGKSKNYISIELDLFPGKTRDQKLKMFKMIEAGLLKFNIQKDDILIIYREPKLENWFIRGSTAYELHQYLSTKADDRD